MRITKMLEPLKQVVEITTHRGGGACRKTTHSQEVQDSSRPSLQPEA